MEKARGMLRQDASPIDWGAVGGIIATVVVGAAGAIGLKKRSDDSSKKPPNDDDLAVETLRSIVKTLQEENTRLWARNAEQETRYTSLNTRCDDIEKELREIRSTAARLRAQLVKAQIDPGQ